MPLVNAKEMVFAAYKNGYAIPHININNLEMAKAILETAQKLHSPIIIAVTDASLDYLGGLKTVYGMVTGLIQQLNITIPVALHLDHGKLQTALEAIDVGFTSVMYDGHKESFEINYQNTKKLVAKANLYNVSVEAEIGAIGGEEDGVISQGEIASINEAKAFNQLGISFLAAGMGNIHGQYPANWKSLNFDLIAELRANLTIPLVMHGGSGIPDEQLQKAIAMGVSKININTEILLAYAKGIKTYLNQNDLFAHRNYDIKKWVKWRLITQKQQ
ncbi:class II fructose-bisphosphate aldolase [Candidatus Mycoplasma pogonae]